MFFVCVWVLSDCRETASLGLFFQRVLLQSLRCLLNMYKAETFRESNPKLVGRLELRTVELWIPCFFFPVLIHIISLCDIQDFIFFEDRQIDFERPPLEVQALTQIHSYTQTASI